MAVIEGKYLSSLFVREAPTGAIDGSNTSFAISQLPAAANALHLFLDGVKLRPTTHYSLSGTTITMVDAPIVGQDLEANYIHA